MLADRDEAWGSATDFANVKIMSWFDHASNVPMSSHAASSGMPRGGNFLFEDGHVRWYSKNQIQLGSASKMMPGYLSFYKIPIEGE